MKRGQRGEGQATRRAGGVVVEDDGGRRPFMRGIMVHALLARGVSFEDAYRTANTVREGLRGRARVTRAELAKAVRDSLGAAAPSHEVRRAPLPEVLVTGQARPMPFSKGLLSQSLLAAAIDPNEAFEVARRIEQALVSQSVKEIERQALRRLAYETLRGSLGERIARRYLVWRRFVEPERPVIILLGGATGAGKTSLAVEVAHRLGITRTLSTDSIRQIMRIMLSPELVPAIHASSYEAYRMLPPSGSEEAAVVEGFRAQAASVAVGVRAMIDRAVAETTSIILDGVSIVPGLIDMGAYAQTAHVIFLVVATLAPEAYRARFESRAKKSGPRARHDYVEHLDAILEIQDYFLDQADQFGVPIVDNDSFEDSVLSILRHVTETLREQGGYDEAELL